MDSKDVRIFCEMAFKYLEYNAFTKRHVSPSSIGRKLDLDEKTVRARIRTMEDDGFIQYYQAIPNPSLFGLRSMGFYSFEAADIRTKHAALEHLARAPGVVEAYDMVGPGFLATLAGPSADDVQRTANRMLLDLRIKHSIKLGDRDPKGPRERPDRLGWRLIEQLRYDALRPAQDIARGLSITPKMVEYRISKLLNGGAVFIRAILNAQRQRGLVFYGLVVSVDETRKSQILGAMQGPLGEKLWSLYVPMTGVIVANAFGFTPSEPENATMEVLGLPGVVGCTFAIFKEMLEPSRPNWIDRLVAAEIRGTA